MRVQVAQRSSPDSEENSTQGSCQGCAAPWDGTFSPRGLFAPWAQGGGSQALWDQPISFYCPGADGHQAVPQGSRDTSMAVLPGGSWGAAPLGWRLSVLCQIP